MRLHTNVDHGGVENDYKPISTTFSIHLFTDILD